jgi:hypothetical protein
MAARPWPVLPMHIYTHTSTRRTNHKHTCHISASRSLVVLATRCQRGCGRLYWRIPDPVERGAEHHEELTSNGIDCDGKCHDQLLLLRHEPRLECTHAVMWTSARSMHHHREYDHGSGHARSPTATTSTWRSLAPWGRNDRRCWMIGAPWTSQGHTWISRRCTCM